MLGGMVGGGWAADSWVRERGGAHGDRGREEVGYEHYEEWGRGPDMPGTMGFHARGRRHDAMAAGVHSNKRSHSHVGLAHGCMPGMDGGRGLLHESGGASRHAELFGGGHGMGGLHHGHGMDHGDGRMRLRGSDALDPRMIDHHLGAHIDARDARYGDGVGDGRYGDGRGGMAVLGYAGGGFAHRTHGGGGGGGHRGMGDVGAARAQRSDGGAGRGGCLEDGGDDLDGGLSSSGVGSGRLVETWLGSYLTSRAAQVTPPSRRVR